MILINPPRLHPAPSTLFLFGHYPGEVSTMPEMPEIMGHKVFGTQKECDEESPGAGFFFKITNKEFGAFPTREDFIRWFDRYRKYCHERKLAVQYYEVVRDRFANAFYADIEVYSPKILEADEVTGVQDVIVRSVEKNMRAGMPGRMTTKPGAWTADHRQDTNQDGYKFKVSLHVVFNDLVFDNPAAGGPMAALAGTVDTLALKDLRKNGGELFKIPVHPDR